MAEQIYKSFKHGQRNMDSVRKLIRMLLNENEVIGKFKISPQAERVSYQEYTQKLSKQTRDNLNQLNSMGITWKTVIADSITGQATHMKTVTFHKERTATSLYISGLDQAQKKIYYVKRDFLAPGSGQTYIVTTSPNATLKMTDVLNDPSLLTMRGYQLTPIKSSSTNNELDLDQLLGKQTSIGKIVRRGVIESEPNRGYYNWKGFIDNGTPIDTRLIVLTSIDVKSPTVKINLYYDESNLKNGDTVRYYSGEIKKRLEMNNPIESIITAINQCIRGNNEMKTTVYRNFR